MKRHFRYISSDSLWAPVGPILDAALFAFLLRKFGSSSSMPTGNVDAMPHAFTRRSPTDHRREGPKTRQSLPMGPTFGKTKNTSAFIILFVKVFVKFPWVWRSATALQSHKKRTSNKQQWTFLSKHMFSSCSTCLTLWTDAVTDAFQFETGSSKRNVGVGILCG